MIDVREPDEVVQGSIPSAVNLPLSVLPNALHLPPEEFKEIERLLYEVRSSHLASIAVLIMPLTLRT